MGISGRILVVEDDGTARAALAEILSQEGYEVDTAASGASGLAHLREFAPDVVLTDMSLPGMDGLGLIKRIRQTGSHCGMVLMTANQHAVNQADAAGVEHVCKPIDLNLLYRVIDRAMDRAAHH